MTRQASHRNYADNSRKCFYSVTAVSACVRDSSLSASLTDRQASVHISQHRHAPAGAGGEITSHRLAPARLGRLGLKCDEIWTR